MADNRRSIRRRRLSVEIKKARVEAGKTIEEVSEATEWSMGKISNIETGVRLKPTVMEIRGLLDVYGVTDERRREAILNLTRQARELGWWSKFSDVFTDDFVAFEGEAHSIRTYELARIPGLLQTPRYVVTVQVS
ncbi:Scr1 family TA system antitoxin-like transcriptional regulator [Nocardiopsis exhalans]|uniref:Scr1 family TA system antitoxin-like transcriptional regulator n=1 Tax=Nocardiopsis exhalans TaxID=163604 RepID=A0ABY5D5E8_9ACTN|nr:Scr1 family TA system antitoxin-like transcriptional regulator [Nocardiopsis exhalans]USY19579.1 Scr1 family TA system antitoxin-like transcriptional regulator [Nocardiopsis exhalans]